MVAGAGIAGLPRALSQLSPHVSAQGESHQDNNILKFMSYIHCQHTCLWPLSGMGWRSRALSLLSPHVPAEGASH